MAKGEWSGRLGAGLNPRRMLLVASLFIIGYFGVSIVGNAVTRYQLDRQQEELRREIAALREQQRRLEALRAYMQSDEFIERSARDLGLVRPGDTAVVVSAPTPAAVATVPPGLPWWERYFREPR
jgi:cell division protein FtsB